MATENQGGICDRYRPVRSEVGAQSNQMPALDDEEASSNANLWDSAGLRSALRRRGFLMNSGNRIHDYIRKYSVLYTYLRW